MCDRQRSCVYVLRRSYLQSGLLRRLGRARCPGLATRPRPCAWRWSQRTVRFALSSWRVWCRGGLRCLVSIACCRRGSSSRHELKRFPDKCRLTIATVAGPITAPAAPKLRGPSAERVNRTPWVGPNLTLQIQTLPFISTSSIINRLHDPMVFNDNYNSEFGSSLTACSQLNNKCRDIPICNEYILRGFPLPVCLGSGARSFLQLLYLVMISRSKFLSSNPEDSENSQDCALDIEKDFLA